jgi:hypothetical protein
MRPQYDMDRTVSMEEVLSDGYCVLLHYEVFNASL